MSVIIKLPIQSEAQIADLIREGKFGTINVKVAIYLKLILPMKQDNLSFLRG